MPDGDTLELICEKDQLNAYATQVGFIGLFMGAYFGGTFAEKFGRKRTMIVALVGTAVGLIGQSLVPTGPSGYYCFLVARILAMAFNHMAYLSFCCYVTEIVGPEGRKITGMVPNFMYAFGQGCSTVAEFTRPFFLNTVTLSVGLFLVCHPYMKLHVSIGVIILAS